MSTKTDIWMPFYVADYLADTTRLTTEQHGAYMLLILDYWRNGPPPADDATLAQITRMPLDAWSNARSKVLAFFEQRDGMLVHNRIEREKASAACNKDKKTTRAKAAAEARWGKNAPSNAPSTPQALPKECPSPSPTPSPNGDKKDIGAAAPGLPEVVLERRAEKQAAIEDILPTDDQEAAKVPRFDAKAALIAEGVGQQHIDDYLKIRKAHRAPFTQSSLDGLKREAAKAQMTVAAAVATCCENSWRGFKAEWLKPGQQRSVAAAPSKFHGLNEQDHSAAAAIHAASMKRLGIEQKPLDPNDPIDF